MKMSRAAKLIFSGLALTLSGCGFQPLYGEAIMGGVVSEELQSIKVETVDSRTGVVMRNLLLDRLTPKIRPGDRAIMKNWSDTLWIPFAW